MVFLVFVVVAISASASELSVSDYSVNSATQTAGFHGQTLFASRQESAHISTYLQKDVCVYVCMCACCSFVLCGDKLHNF